VYFELLQTQGNAKVRIPSTWLAIQFSKTEHQHPRPDDCCFRNERERRGVARTAVLRQGGRRNYHRRPGSSRAGLRAFSPRRLPT